MIQVWYFIAEIVSFARIDDWSDFWQIIILRVKYIIFQKIRYIRCGYNWYYQYWLCTPNSFLCSYGIVKVTRSLMLLFGYNIKAELIRSYSMWAYKEIYEAFAICFARLCINHYRLLWMRTAMLKANNWIGFRIIQCTVVRGTLDLTNV